MRAGSTDDLRWAEYAVCAVQECVRAAVPDGLYCGRDIGKSAAGDLDCSFCRGFGSSTITGTVWRVDGFSGCVGADGECVEYDQGDSPDERSDAALPARRTVPNQRRVDRRLLRGQR